MRRPIGLPVDLARPVRPLHAVVAGEARVGADQSALEQRQKVGQLVALRVVDRIARHHRNRDGGTRQRRRFDVIDRAHHGRDRVRVQRFLRSLHGDQLAKPRIL